jgi:hypothetical protein
MASDDNREYEQPRAATNMHSTIMHFAICLQDWNSLDSVRRANSDLEGAALVFFALLVVSEAMAHISKDEKRKHVFDALGIVFFSVAVLSEIVAYPYGQRNDTLSGNIIVSLDQKAGDAKDSAEKTAKAADRANAAALDAEGTAITASEKVDLETKKREQLGTEVGWRKLTPDQQQKIGKACKGTIDDAVSVSSYGMNPEAKALSVQVAKAIFNHTFLVTLDTSGIVTSAALDVGVLISAPVEKIDFANCLANSLRVIGRLKSVSVNGKRHRDGATMGGNAVMGGRAVMGGGGGAPTIVIPPTGSPIGIFIGIKPLESTPIKQ